MIMCRWRYLSQLVVVLASVCLDSCRGHFSLYVTQAEMKRLTVALHGTFLVHSEDQDTFGAVTNIRGLEGLYLRLRIREPHLDPDSTTDVEIRKRICQSITKSGFFAANQKYPLDMDELHKSVESDSRSSDSLEMGTPTTFYEKLREDYEKKWFRRVRYSYRSRLTTFGTGFVKTKEFAFACAVRQRESSDIILYCISDEYNVNAALDVPTGRRIRARFVGEVTWHSICNVIAIAEESATAFSHVDYSVEDVYLQMREFYEPVGTAFDDPVCGLSKLEKLRVCASVMTSFDFTHRVKFSKTLENFEAKCELTTVLLRTNDQVTHQDWMLTCPVEPVSSAAKSAYFVSRAHHSHYVVVYFHDEDTGNWYIENISANISVIIDRHQENRLRRPNFVKLLNESRKLSESSLVVSHELNLI